MKEQSPQKQEEQKPWPQAGKDFLWSPQGHSGLAKKDGDWCCLNCQKDNVDKDVHTAGKSNVGWAQQVSYALDELKKNAPKLRHDGITIKDQQFTCSFCIRNPLPRYQLFDENVAHVGTKNHRKRSSNRSHRTDAEGHQSQDKCRGAPVTRPRQRVRGISAKTRLLV
jgi:hypothetical protein